jgi:hypothetical protein
MTNTSIETQPIFIALAIATANALECSDCSERLREALGEVATNLIEKLSPSIAFELRALALAYPEPEKMPTSQMGAKAAALNGASGT